MNPQNLAIEESVKLNLNQPCRHGQDLTELLNDIFGEVCKNPEDEVLKNLTENLTLENEYGKKYAERLEMLCQAHKKEKNEIKIVDSYIQKLNFQHELKKNSGKIIEDEKTDEIYDVLGKESEISDGMSEYEYSQEEENSTLDDKKQDFTSVSSVLEDESYQSLSEGGDNILKADSVDSDSSKRGISSEIGVFPTLEESILLQKYAVLFSEPLFLEIASSTKDYPSNRGLKSSATFLKTPYKKIVNEQRSCRTKMLDAHKDKVNKEINTNRIGVTNSTKLQANKFVFKAIPSPVMFIDCKPGKIYQTTLELRNITDIAQSCSVLPPKSGVFLIGEGQYPTKNRRYVAPGLSCKFIIRFRPEFYKDFEDEVAVFTSQEQSFSVKILAKRNNPRLEFKTIWDCGECFVYSKIISLFTIKNSGGPGKFWLFANELDDKKIEYMFKHGELVDKENLCVKNFRISPSCFKLETNQSTRLSVHFSPDLEGCFIKHIFVVCDNLKTVSNFSVTGRSLCLNKESVSLHGTWNYPRPQDVWDAFTDYFINFENVYAYKVEKITFAIINNCAFPLKFRWDSISPRRDPAVSDIRSVLEPSLSIYPTSGELPSCGEVLITLRYKPVKEMNLHVVYQLVITDVPKKAVDKNMDKHIIFGDALKTVDVRLHTIDVQGRCSLYDVAIQPPELIISGLLEVGITHRQIIIITNNSSVPAYFGWGRCMGTNIIEVGPVVGYIGASHEMNLEVLITPTQTGKYVETLECNIQDLEKPLQLTISFEVTGPKVVIENGNINLGLIRVGTKASGMLTFRNTVAGDVSWRLKDVTGQALCNQAGICNLQIIPSFGELKSLSRQSVIISVKPTDVGSLHNVIELEVQAVAVGHVAIFGEVLAPHVCLQECTFFAGTVYRSVPFSTVVTLVNQTPLDTGFNWDEAEGVDAQSCTITFDPIKGIIRGDEHLSITVTCTVNHLISFHDVCIPCWIGGMSEPLYWSLCGEVNGIEIFCSLDNESRRYCATLREGGCEDEPHFDLDFGIEISLGSVVVREIHLTNNSAIKAKYTANLKNFSATSVDERSEEQTDQTSKHLNLSNKRINGLLQRGLETGSGLALLVYPSAGWILPFTCTCVQVIGKSDMWGVYKDLLTIQISELKLIHMNICYNSVGIPFRFVAASRDGSRFTLRFGACHKETPPISRKVKIENTGPCDLNIEFKNFVNAENSATERMPLVRVDLYYNENVFYKNSNDCEKCKKWLYSDAANDNSVAREKLICLDLTPYVGDEKSDIFSLTPNIVKLRARSEATLVATFDPPMRKLIGERVNFCCYTRGIVTVPIEMLSIPNKVYRQHGRGVQLIEMEMSGSLINPKLLHCASDENDFYFELNSGEFLFGKPDIQELARTISFVNTSPVAMNIHCTTSEPFSIVACKVNAKKVAHVADLQETNRNITEEIVLQPADVLKVTLNFTLNRKLVDDLCCKRPCYADERVSCRIFDTENPNQLIFEQDLLFDTGKTDSETFQLRGIIHLPYLNIAVSHVDFGTCLIGQSHSREIGLLNYSHAETSFCVVYQNNVNEFRVDPTEGCVPQMIDRFAPGRTDLDVYFQPKSKIRYRQCVIIYGPFGMEPQRVVLEGMGTADETYRRVFDVTSA